MTDDTHGSADPAREHEQHRSAPRTVTAAPVAPAVHAAGTSRSTAAPIAWLALLLALLIGGASLYFSMEAQRREADLLQRVRSLEMVEGQDSTTFDQLRDNLERRIALETEAMQARQQRAAEDLQRALAEQQRTLGEQQSGLARQAQAVSRLEALTTESAQRTQVQLGEQLQALESRLLQQEQRIGDLSAEDRQSWALAEARYLLRLANQRLIAAGDTLSAQAMLGSADKLLRELSDTDLGPLRAAIADDLAALRAVPRLDTQGLYLRLDALIQQTAALVMFEPPQREAAQPLAVSDDWQTRLQRGFRAALGKLSEYIVVSRRDVPVEALMDPQYEGLLRQNLRMLLEQAQVAMLSGNQALYEASLERALGWINEFFGDDQQAVRAMAAELDDLAGERVSVDLPDLGASLTALDEVLSQRLGSDGR